MRSFSPLGLAYPLLVCLAVSASGQAPPPVGFEDVSHLVPFEHQSLAFGGMGLGGAAWFDYDADGDLDLLLTNGPTLANGLFRNDGDGTFTEVAEAAGVQSFTGNSGVLAGDVDNDGYPDLFLTGDDGQATPWAGAPAKLYWNQGDGTFADVTATSGIDPPRTQMGASFGDVDDDGFLDLFVCAPGSDNWQLAERNQLYRNNGDLTFTDISASAGVDTDQGACAALFHDWDGDGLEDIYVVNCNGIDPFVRPLELFHNQGDLTFVDVAPEAGLTEPGLWMGGAMGDCDNDGDQDLFVTNYGYGLNMLGALYSRQAGGEFENVGATANAYGLFFGWGCAMRDLDNDGWPDVFYAGSLPQAIDNPGVLMFNDQDGTFTHYPDGLPLNLGGSLTSGVAVGDYDGDGFQDLVVVREPFFTKPGTPVLFRNLGNENGAVTVRLEGTVSNRGAVGAEVRVRAGAVTQSQVVFAGSSFLSTDSPWLTFGLGQQPATQDLEVAWPSGLVEHFPNAYAGTTVTLVEGTGCAEPCDALRVDAQVLSLAWGGDQTYALDAGPEHAGALYLLVGSTSGTEPGTPGPPHVPLNYDLYTKLGITDPNHHIEDSAASLDAEGRATARFDLAAGTDPSVAGLRLDHAFVVLDFTTLNVATFVSNPVPLLLVP